MSRHCNFMDIVREHSETVPHVDVCQFLTNTTSMKGPSLSYADLDLRAKKIATVLQQRLQQGDRVLVLHKPGLDYIVSLFACFYSGMVVVPVFSPSFGNLKNSSARLMGIINDCTAAAILCSQENLEAIEALVSNQAQSASIYCIASDAVDAVDESLWRVPNVRTDDVSLLQYTSGSTSTPKGVMVTQNNLINNISTICKAYRMYDPGHLVIWLPPYHDMGLIGGILAPIFTQYPLTLMSPLSFIKDPLGWLRIITDRRATISGGPNFAYALCEKALVFNPEIELDLSTWSIAFCGAEPVKSQTVDGFTKAFAAFGLKRSSFSVCYGLAESTLMVSTSLLSSKDSPVITSFDHDTLVDNHKVQETLLDDQHSKRLVSCGPVIAGHEIAVVDGETYARMPADTVGEIWVSGRSVAKGYWGKAELTQQTFFAKLADENEQKHWLRTGDYGFVHDGEIYITGRIKDMIIVRGQNYYPQDIESLTESLHDALSFGSAVAFSVEGRGDGEDSVVLIQEVRSVNDHDELATIAGNIRQAVSQQLALHLAQVVLVPPKTIPKTTSGKVQRSLTKERYVNKQMDILLLSETNGSGQIQCIKAIDVKKFLINDIVKLVRSSINEYLEERFGSNRQSGYARSLIDFGLDSIHIIELKNHLENVFDITLDASTIYENSDLAYLCDYIADQIMHQRIRQQPAQTLETNVSGGDDIDPGSQAIFYTCLFNPGSSVYTISRALRLCAELDIDKLRIAVNHLLSIHPSLRSIYALKKERIVRSHIANTDDVLIIEDVSELSQEILIDSVRARASEPLALDSGPLMQLIYYKAGLQQDVLLFKVHHIVSDHWSLASLCAQLSEYYQQLCDGHHLYGESVQLPLRDPILSLYDTYRASEQIVEDRTFWQSYLADIEFPNWKRHELSSVETFTISIGDDISNNIISFAKKNNATPFTALLTAYQLSVCELLKKDIVVTGIPITLRDNRSISDYMGYCSNLLPVVIRALPQRDIQTVYTQITQSVEQVLRHKKYSFSQLVADLKVSRDHDYLPVFDTLFVYHASSRRHTDALGALSINAQPMAITLFGIDAQIMPLASKNLLSPLCFSIALVCGQYQCLVEYDNNEFNAQGIRELSERFKYYLTSISQGSSRLDLPEKQRLVRQQVNQTQQYFEHSDKCLDQLFMAQAYKTPDAVAVIMGEQSMTYRQLQRNVERWARVAAHRKQAANELIAIVMDKSIDQVVASLAIMAAGCAYLPIDVDFSEQKITELLELGDVRTVFTQSCHEHKLRRIAQQYNALMSIELVDQSPYSELDQNTLDLSTVQHSSSDLAYVIFTSGSTGKPKGVMIEHQQVVNTLLDINQRFNVGANDRVLALSNFDFDLSVYDIFGVLAAGGALVLCEKVHYKEPAKWQALIKQHGITLWNSVPMFMQMLVEHASGGDDNCTGLQDSLRLIVLSGDWIPLNLPERIFNLFNDKQSVDLIAMGGATECSIWSNYFKVERVEPHWRSIPYGRPLANQYYEILDSRMQPCPDGISGDLYIGGVGVARGYWKDEDKTRVQFVQHPVTGERLYRTGDRALYWDNGIIEFLGREDDQVKIGGYRIELGDITSRLKQCQSVKDALVALQRDNDKPQLVAYLILEDNAVQCAETVETVRQQLTPQLPPYMWPEHYLMLDAFPLSRNGKVDKKALSHQAVALRPKHRKKASGDLQIQLVNLWRDVLSLDEVYVNDNFFELGGNSLLVVKLNNRISNALNVQLDVITIINNQTIESLEYYIRNHYVHHEIEPINKRQRVIFSGND